MKTPNGTHDQKPTLSIQAAMQNLSRRMDVVLDAQEANGVINQTIPDELRFWIAADPLLADLYKQLQDARAHHTHIAERHGKYDPMSSVARDAEDSAESAFETRLIELRRDEDTKSQVAAMIAKALHDADQAETDAARARATWFWQAFARRRPGPAPARSGADHIFAIALGLMALQAIIDDANDSLSAMGESFSRAAKQRREEKLSRDFAACG